MADKTGYIGRNPGDSSVKVARQTFTPTTTTSSFTFASGYTVGYLDLYLNGAKLIEGTDYNANNGSAITMVSDAQSGDVLEAVAYKAFNVGDAASSTAGNFSVGNDITVSNDATITNDLNVLGIGTVAKGFNVSAGGINVTGVITATSFAGDGSALTGVANTDVLHTREITVSGVSTFTGNVFANGAIGVNEYTPTGKLTVTQDPQGFPVDSSQDKATVLIKHGTSGSNRRWIGIGASLDGAWIQSSSPGGTGLSAPLNLNPGGGDIVIPSKLVHYDDADTYLTFGANTIGVEAGGNQAFKVESTGVTGAVFSGITTFKEVDVKLNGTAGVSSVTWDASANSLIFKDNSKAVFGDGSDLEVYHDGAGDNIIQNTVANTDIIIRGTHGEGGTPVIQLNPRRDQTGLQVKANQSVELYYDGSKKLESTLTGAKTTGVSSCTSHCMPTADVGGDLGSTTNRWANIYTADMQLSNEGSQNDIDGTWGKYTIQEGENDLFLINRRTGKKYKFMLEEVQ